MEYRSLPADTRLSAIRLVAILAAVATFLLPARLLPAQVNVTVNAASIRAVAPLEGLGMGTAVYANQFGNSNLDDRLNEAGVTTLRYSGGGYADIYHWSIHQDSPFGGGTDKGYVASQTTFPGLLNIMNNMGNGQAVITVDYGSAMKLSSGTTVAPDFGGQPQEAAAWVAYANADPNIYGTANDVVLGADAQGNDWKTAGYWAKLRASTQAQYQTWATADGVYNSQNNFLAINRPTPAGIKYWEIGNETFGTGYYGGGNGYSTDYHQIYDGTNRSGNANLSPAHYGTQVATYSQLMKSVDPTIKVGAVLATPPDDYSWAGSGASGWNEQVLSQAAVNINVPNAGSLPATDFVIVHWYPSAGTNANGTTLLSQPRIKIDPMINGSTAGQDSGAAAGVRDTLAAKGIPNAEIMVTEFNYNGSLQSGVQASANSLFVADTYATFLDNGVKSIQYLELNKNSFIGDGSSLTRGEAFYAIKMLNTMSDPGDELVNATSSNNSAVRAHAALQDDGTVAVMLLNLSTTSQTVNVSISGSDLTSNGTQYVSAGTNITSTALSNLGNAFSASIPSRTMYLYLIEAQSGVLGDLNDDGIVDSQDIDVLWNVVRIEVPGDQDPGDNDNEDFNHDGFLNEKDVDYMLNNLLTVGSGRAYGDADLDGGVGGLDYTAWRNRAGTGWANGDFDGDGGVGGLDYALWRTRPTAYPGSVGLHGSGLQGVPEPSTIGLMGLGLLVLLPAMRKSARV